MLSSVNQFNLKYNTVDVNVKVFIVFDLSKTVNITLTIFEVRYEKKKINTFFPAELLLTKIFSKASCPTTAQNSPK